MRGSGPQYEDYFEVREAHSRDIPGRESICKRKTLDQVIELLDRTVLREGDTFETDLR